MKFLISLIFVVVACHLAFGQLCFTETNNARQANGKAPFGSSPQLIQAAVNHNNAMVKGNCFSHQCPGEPSLGDRITAAGYKWRGAAENLAAGSSNCQGSVNQWLGSPGHRANLLGDLKHFGCASINCNCQYGTYWTCVYATPL